MSELEPIASYRSPVRASALASWQLVEDARHRSPDRSAQRERVRALAQRTLADRRFQRDSRAS